MKRRWADRREWAWLTARQFSAARTDREPFCGYRTTLLLQTMLRPIWVQFHNSRFCVADSGYLWVQYFPDGAQHTVTCMFDGDGALIQWYIDICAAWGVSDEGMPWFDDLYLDIVVMPDGAVELLDEDELEQALVVGDISLEDFQRAQDEARMVLSSIEEGRFSLIELSVADVTEVWRELSLAPADLSPETIGTASPLHREPPKP